MKIPFMRLDRQFESLGDGLMTRIRDLFAGGRVLQSPEVERLEQRLAKMHAVAHGVAVNSGTDALIFALMTLDLPPGSRVGVPAMSFVASASAIVHAGHRPVFLDVDPDTMLASYRGRDVAAVVAVHLYGQMVDLDGVAVPIVEDAAQALGSKRNGRPPGAHGRVTCLSFDPTKPIGAYGSGGAILTNDAKIAEAARRLRYHGHIGNRVYDRPGFNAQMDSVQAVILDAKLDHLDAWQRRRDAIAHRYMEGCKGTAARPLAVLPGNTHNWHKFVVRCARRDALAAHLQAVGVQTSIHYSPPLHRQPAFGSAASLPEAERAAAEVLSLPIYPELTDAEVDAVVAAVRSFA